MFNTVKRGGCQRSMTSTIEIATLVTVLGIAAEKLLDRFNVYHGIQHAQLRCSSCCSLDIQRRGTPPSVSATSVASTANVKKTIPTKPPALQNMTPISNIDELPISLARQPSMQTPSVLSRPPSLNHTLHPSTRPHSRAHSPTHSHKNPSSRPHSRAHSPTHSHHTSSLPSSRPHSRAHSPTHSPTHSLPSSRPHSRAHSPTHYSHPSSHYPSLPSTRAPSPTSQEYSPPSRDPSPPHHALSQQRRNLTPVPSTLTLHTLTNNSDLDIPRTSSSALPYIVASALPKTFASPMSSASTHHHAPHVPPRRAISESNISNSHNPMAITERRSASVDYGRRPSIISNTIDEESVIIKLQEKED